MRVGGGSIIEPMRFALMGLGVAAVGLFVFLFHAPLSGGDKDAIRDVISRYVRASNAKDGSEVCRTLTTTMRDRYDNCEKESPIYGDSEGRPLTVTDISGSGDSADAVVNFKGKIDGQRIHTAFGVALRQADGEWLIDEDGSCLGPRSDICE